MLDDLFAVLVPLFVATTPFTVVPLFFAMTEGRGEKEAKALAHKAVLTALSVAVVIIFAGQAIFGALGITLDDLRVGGGLILLVISIYDLVFSTNRRKQSEVEEDDGADLGVVPLGVPIIVGPATMTACVTLAEGYGTFVTLVGLVLNLGLTAILLHNGHIVRKVISPGVAGAIGKVMSLFLAGIAVAMIRSGITAMLAG